MSVTRKNTVVIDFSILPVRPDATKIQQFLEKEIKLELKDVENLQLHSIRNCVYIEVKDSETAARYQSLHNNKHLIFHGDKGFKIPVYVESDAVPVRVHDLPPAMKHTTVIDFLLKYGDVISVTRERWKHFFPGVYNGVRILYMRIKRPIPSYVTISGHETLITYPGQHKSCRWCHQAAHPGQKCSSQINPTSINTVQKTVTSATENRPALNLNDFPPLDPKQTIPVSVPQIEAPTSSPTTAANETIEHHTKTGENVHNTNDGDDDDDGDSSSSGTIETRSKRRLKTKKANERKKICSNQVSLNDDQSIVDGRSKSKDFLMDKDKSKCN